MREEAEKMNIEVHGSIWIIDELVTKSLISNEKAIVLPDYNAIFRNTVDIVFQFPGFLRLSNP